MKFEARIVISGFVKITSSGIVCQILAKNLTEIWIQIFENFNADILEIVGVAPVVVVVVVVVIDVVTVVVVVNVVKCFGNVVDDVMAVTSCLIFHVFGRLGAAIK